MIAVVIAAVGSAAMVLRERSERFAQIAEGYDSGFGAWDCAGYLADTNPDGKPDEAFPPRIRRLLWDARMGVKYEHAARYPWLPVEPDSPIPDWSAIR